MAFPIISSLRPFEYMLAVSHVFMPIFCQTVIREPGSERDIPLSHAAFNTSRASFSSINQSAQFLLPNDIAPRIGTDNRRPDEPSRAYDTFVASRLACAEAGSFGPLISSL